MYTTVKVIKATDGTISRDCRSFSTADEAKVRYFGDLSKAIGADNTAYVLMVILDEVGNIVDREVWYATAEVTE